MPISLISRSEPPLLLPPGIFPSRDLTALAQRGDLLPAAGYGTGESGSAGSSFSRAGFTAPSSNPWRAVSRVGVAGMSW